MTVLYVTLIIIAIIGLIMLLPIKAVISFALNSDENEIVIRYLFFKLKLYPKEVAEEEASKENGGTEEEKKKKSSKDFLETVKLTWSEMRWGISKLLEYILKRAIIIKELNISARFGTGDPMNTGLAYGGANAVVYNIIGLLDRQARLKKWSVELDPDFDNAVVEAGIYCRLHTRILHIFPLAAIILRTFVKIKKKTKRENNGGKKNEQSN